MSFPFDDTLFYLTNTRLFIYSSIYNTIPRHFTQIVTFQDPPLL